MAAKVPPLLHKMSASSQKAWYKKHGMDLPPHLSGAEGRSAAQAKMDVGEINKKKAREAAIAAAAASKKNKELIKSSERVRQMAANIKAFGGERLGGDLTTTGGIIQHIRGGGTIKGGRLGEETQLDEANVDNKAKKKDWVRKLGLKAMKAGKVDPARGHIPQRAGREVLRGAEATRMIRRAMERELEYNPKYKTEEVEQVVEGFDTDPADIAAYLVDRHGKGKVTMDHIEAYERGRDSHRPIEKHEVMKYVKKMSEENESKKKPSNYPGARLQRDYLSGFKSKRPEDPHDREERLSRLATGEKAGRWAHGGKYEEVEMSEPVLNEVSKSEAEKVLGGPVKEKPTMPPGKQPAGYRYVRSLARKAMKAKLKEEVVVEEVKDAADVGEYDYEGDMAKSQLRSILTNAKRLHDMLEDTTNLPEWVQSKITLAEDYILTAANYMEGEMNEEKKGTESYPLLKAGEKLKPMKLKVAEETTEESTEQVEEKYMGFKAVEKAVAEKGARNPAAVAAYIGRKKYGKEKFQAMAAAGKRAANEEVEQVTEAEGKVAVTDKEKELAAHHGDKTKITYGDVIKARIKSAAEKAMKAGK